MTKRLISVGIASVQEQKARMMAIARGEYKPKKSEPKIWFSSIESLSQVLSSDNQLLLEIIERSKPASIKELAELSGRHASNLSRTLSTLENYGLVKMEKVGHSKVPSLSVSGVRVNVPFGERAVVRAIGSNGSSNPQPA